MLTISGHMFVMNDYTCSMEDGKIITKTGSEKKEEMLEMVEVDFKI